MSKCFFSKNKNICATCEYYGGERKIDAFLKDVVVESINKGDCYNKNTPRFGQVYCTSDRCNVYKKWSLLE
jgi:hypothetical protein